MSLVPGEGVTRSPREGGKGECVAWWCHGVGSWFLWTTHREGWRSGLACSGFPAPPPNTLELWFCTGLALSSSRRAQVALPQRLRSQEKVSLEFWDVISFPHCNDKVSMCPLVCLGFVHVPPLPPHLTLSPLPTLPPYSFTLYLNCLTFVHQKERCGGLCFLIVCSG